MNKTDVALILEIEEVRRPKAGFQNMGWYNGRQFYKDQFGMPNSIMFNDKKRCVFAYKKLSLKQRVHLIIKFILSKEIYI